MNKKIFKAGQIKIPVWLKTLILIFLILFFIKLLILIIPLKSLNLFIKKQNSSRFYDRNGQLMYVMPLEDGLRREYCPLKKIPGEVIEAFIDAEDKNFYFHPGVDLFSVFRAAKQNKEAGRVVSGASTITMQLVRLIYPRKGKVNGAVKIKEMFMALLLDAKLSKKQILELYLNNVPFGFQIEGIASAARSFYGLEVSALNSQQIQLLAKIPRRPVDYAPQKTYTYPFLSPHFINTVIKEYKEKNKIIPNDVYLCVDASFSLNIENAIQRKLDEFKDARIHNGCALVINNHTGEIYSWVGNAAYTDTDGGQIDGVLVRNQPGSSMKPFLYALALEYGHEPSEILPDIPMDFGSSQVYVPLNFNNKYNGPVRMRVALASSLNIPAVYTLYNIHVDDYMHLLSKLGYKSLEGERNKTGLSIALGSSEVTLYEMVRAFSVFTRDGYLPELTCFLKKNAKLCNEEKIFSSDTARILCDFLSDKSARALGFGSADVFDTPYPCIFKTGTSNQYQNIIALASTTEFTAGVWMGNFGGETVIHQTGSSIPAAIVRQIMDELTKKYGTHSFKESENFEKVPVCTLSGMNVNTYCPSVSLEYVKKSNAEKRPLCSWHYLQCNLLKVKYPSIYQHWASGQNMAGSIQNTVSELQILYPTQGAVFMYDPSIPQKVQSLRIQAYGGKKNKAELFVDGISYGLVQGRFVWYVPLTKGTHFIKIECEGESVTSSYCVQ